MGDQDPDRTAAEMEQHLHEVEQHIDEARKRAPDARLDESADLEGVAGDVSDQEGGPMFGEDPEGAVDDARARGEEG